MKLIEELLTYKKDIDAIQIAEILWLTKTISQSTIPKADNLLSGLKKEHNKQEHPDNDTREEENNPSTDKKDDSLPEEIEHTIVIQKVKEQSPEYGLESNANTSSYVTDIVHKHKYPNIIKQFQSLRIKQKRLDKTLLDEDKSADYIATTELFHPIFKENKNRESYLTLHLIVDINESMFLWEDTIEHFKKSLLNAKLFEDMVIFNLDSKEEKATLSYAKSKRKIEPTSNIFKKEKSLTLLFTDVIGKAWRTNDVFKRILIPWSKHTFVTIVSMLPKRMWQRTPLHQGVSLFMKSHKFLPKNSDLKSEYDFIEDTFGNESNKIPIIPYDKYGFEYLSHILTAKKGSWIDTRVFDGLEDVALDEQSNTEIDAKERVDNFFASSTPDTIKLAIYCSVLPLHKKIIEELIRVKKIGNELEAFPEFYFGGLLDKNVQENQEIYSFYSGVRRELVNYITMDEVESIYHILDNVIKKSLGSKRSMLELLYAQDDKEYRLSDIEKSLIELLIEILGEKGRFYQKNIENLTRLLNTVYPEKNWFMMGSEDGDEDEKPRHKVIIDYDFEIAKYPITFNEFDLYCEAKGINKVNSEGWGREEQPVINVSWNDANNYCKWLSLQTGKKYRLPTESEWEYICRAESNSDWYFGDNEKELYKYAWYDENSGQSINKVGTHIGGTKKSNKWGVHDTHGTVLEWCMDDYIDNYNYTPLDGTAYRKEDLSAKVLRGGSWSDLPYSTRSSFRFRLNPSDSDNSTGFRIMRELGYVFKVENKNSSSFMEPEMIKIIHPKTETSFNFSMIKVPQGNFMMGDVYSQKEVTIDYKYEIGKFPVTVKEYMLFIADVNKNYPYPALSNPSPWGEGMSKFMERLKQANSNLNDNFPIVGIDWNDANAYCLWLSEKTGKQYRLPKEEEWEYACRAGTKTTFCFGNKEKGLANYGWYEKNSSSTLHEVGKLKPNPWGIHDMHGNVLEWIDKHDGAKVDVKMLRGGSYKEFSDACSSSHNSIIMYENTQNEYTGFRIVCINEKNFKIKKIVIPKYLTKIPLLPRTLGSSRTNELKDIRKLIDNDKSLVINGLKDRGKTSLVLQYIDLYKKEYQHIAYIPSYSNLKTNFIDTLEKNLQVTGIDNILLELKELPNKKILIIDDVTSDIQQDEEYLNILYKSGWIVILITRESNLGIMTKGHYTLSNFNKNEGVIKILKNRFGFISNSDFGGDVFFHANNLIEDVEFDELSEGDHVTFELGERRDGKQQAINIEVKNFSGIAIISKVVKQLIAQGWDAKDIELDYKISDKNHRADIVLLQESEPISVIEVKSRLNSENMAKAIEQVKFYVKKLDVAFGYVSDGKKISEYSIKDNRSKEIDSFPLPAPWDRQAQIIDNENIKSDITYQCEECESLYLLNCKELHWEQVDGSERGMGEKLEHQAEYFETCNKCDNDMNITFSCWEYPIGAENMRDVFSSGVINLKGDCCKEFNILDAEPAEDDEHDLTLSTIKAKFHEDIYEKLSNKIEEEFKDYDLDANYLPEGIDEAIITGIDIPEELEFTKLIKNDDTYISNIKFETKASLLMLVDRNSYDYMSLKPLPIRDYNKQYHNAESEETLFIEMSIEFKIDKNEKIVDLLIASIDDVVLLEDEHPDEREQDIKNKISDEITSILKTEHLKGLDYFEIHDVSLPSDDETAIITSYDLPDKIEVEDIEIFSNEFDVKIYLEQTVYLDINLDKYEYYSNDEYASFYGAVQDLNKYYVTVEGQALISIELDIKGTRDKDIDSLEALGIEIVDISVVEQIPIGDNIDFDSSWYS